MSEIDEKLHEIDDAEGNLPFLHEVVHSTHTQWIDAVHNLGRCMRDVADLKLELEQLGYPVKVSNVDTME